MLTYRSRLSCAQSNFGMDNFETLLFSSLCPSITTNSINKYHKIHLTPSCLTSFTFPVGPRSCKFFLFSWSPGCQTHFFMTSGLSGSSQTCSWTVLQAFSTTVSQTSLGTSSHTVVVTWHYSLDVHKETSSWAFLFTIAVTCASQNGLTKSVSRRCPHRYFDIQQETSMDFEVTKGTYRKYRELEHCRHKTD